jgi:Flp pilus assembly protein TadG
MAIISPLLFMCVIGLFVGGVLSFNRQQVAALAQEGARYASLRGPNYQKAHDKPMATESDVLNVIRSKAIGMNPQKFTCQLQWLSNNKLVRVVVSYDFKPPAYLPAMTLRSTSVEPVLN